jgi:hypothetical protein
MEISTIRLNFNNEITKHTYKDWNVFWELQKSRKQELKIVASGLLTKKAVIMSAAENNFKSIEELGQCMKASMLLPGVTGDVIRLKGQQVVDSGIEKTWWREWLNDSRGSGAYIPGSEPMVDSQLFQPIPYRSAIKEGCTHVLTLRTLADGQPVIKKLGLTEKLIMYRFFKRKLDMPDILSWMKNHMHKLVYAEDMLFLNQENRNFDSNTPSPKVFCVALPKGGIKLKNFIIY